MEKDNSATKLAANQLLLEKYEPILVIKLMRIPPVEELHTFTKKIQTDFGYNTLVLPGELDTSVEILSVCDIKVKDVEKLQQMVYDNIKLLGEDSSEEVTFKTAKDISDEKTT